MKCRFGSDGFANAIGANRSFIDAASQGIVVGPRLPELLLEEWQGPGPEVASVADPEPLHLVARHRTDPVEPPDRQVLDERRAHPRRDDEQAVGLALVGRHLGEELVVGDARGGGQPGSRADPRPDLFGDLGRRGHGLQVLGDIEIGLVERERFDERSVLGEDRADLMRDRPIDVEPRFHEDQLRALPPGGHRRHGGPDAETAGLVARGRHDPALARAADRDRLAAKLRIVPLLDGCVERIHVDVDNLAPSRRLDHAFYVGRGEHGPSSLDLRHQHGNRGREASLTFRLDSGDRDDRSIGDFRPLARPRTTPILSAFNLPDVYP